MIHSNGSDETLEQVRAELASLRAKLEEDDRKAQFEQAVVAEVERREQLAREAEEALPDVRRSALSPKAKSDLLRKYGRAKYNSLPW